MVLSAISHPSTPIGQNWPTSHAQLLRFKAAIACSRVAVYPAIMHAVRGVIVQNSFRWKKHLRYYSRPAPAARQFATPQPDNFLRSVLCRIQGI